MAAGKGTRLKSKRPKVLHEIGGRALLLHVIAPRQRKWFRPEHIYCIVGHEARPREAAVAPTGVKFVMQEEQRGTGHALQMVKAYFATGEALPKHLLVLSGDVPLITAGDDRRDLRAATCAQQAAMTILTAVPADPTGYGRVLRSAANTPEVTAIVEQKSLNRSSSGRRRSTPASTASRPKRCSQASIRSRPTMRTASIT